MAKIVDRLEAAGILRVEHRRVEGGFRRFKVYRLTYPGELLAEELKGRSRPAGPPILSAGLPGGAG